MWPNVELVLQRRRLVKHPKLREKLEHHRSRRRKPTKRARTNGEQIRPQTKRPGSLKRIMWPNVELVLQRRRLVKHPKLREKLERHRSRRRKPSRRARTNRSRETTTTQQSRQHH